MTGPPEVWFHRVLWGYFPIHWKGFAILLAGVGLVGFGLAAALLLGLQSLLLNGMGIIILGAMILEHFPIRLHRNRRA